MINEFADLNALIAGNASTGLVALAALLATAVAAYTSDQFRSGTYWALAPLSRRLPWNRNSEAIALPVELTSELTLVQVFLLDASGCRARYRKTSLFKVHRPISTYKEAVTAEHRASGFQTMRGNITDTKVERGFYVSDINLGTSIGRGQQFVNVYSADLEGSFLRQHEHWTQEFSYPTKRLVIQIHFPAKRSPKLVVSKTIDDSAALEPNSSAQLIQLYGCRSIVWDIDQPKPHLTYKIEWTW